MVELSLLLTITTLMLAVSIYFGQWITRGVAVAFRAGKATINTSEQGGRQLRQLAGTVAREHSMAMPLDFRGFPFERFFRLHAASPRRRQHISQSLTAEDLSAPYGATLAGHLPVPYGA